jgi:hypothetical protein
MYTYEDLLVELIDMCNERLLTINRYSDYNDYEHYTSLKECCEERLKEFYELV